jgi:uncharacterized protein YprB with RNaseH-like and TPR domain
MGRTKGKKEKMKMPRWSEQEIAHLIKFENTSKSRYALYNELRNMGYNRTFKAISRKIEKLGLSKPKRYVTGHESRLGYLDIETTDLKANIGIMLSWAIKTRDKNETHKDVITKQEIFDGEYDQRIVQTLIDALNQYDLIFTYYGTGFDIPFMRTRAMEWKLRFPVFREVSHKDIYYLVRSKMQLHRSSLKAATQFLGIGGKTNLDPRIWRDATYGEPKALEYVLDHNIADVRILERLHKKIEEYCNSNVVPV